MARRMYPAGLPACMAIALFVAAPLSASGLQVEPVSVTIEGRSDVIWLGNAGNSPMQAQVRVYRWSQDADGDRLDPTTDLVASPPMLRVPMGGRQVVRLVSTGRAGCNDTYRLAIDEIPDQAPRQSGLRYVMHYSVPVFVTHPDCGTLAPRLSWQIEIVEGQARLLVQNSGTLHAQLAQASFVDAHGRRTDLSSGLLGYVLPGSRKVFALAQAPQTFVGGGTIEILVNGERITQPLPIG